MRLKRINKVLAFKITRNLGGQYAPASPHGEVLAAFHRIHHFALKKPAGLLPQLKSTAQFAAANPIFVSRNIINDIKCL
jgi:hypothetical protein